MPARAQAVVTVKNPHGLHARPASLLIKTISAFDCEVVVEHSDCKANAKSIFGLLSLAAGYDTKLTFTARGGEAVAAIEHIRRLFESNFAEAYQAETKNLIKRGPNK
jgi:phosphocarrier protein